MAPPLTAADVARLHVWVDREAVEYPERLAALLAFLDALEQEHFPDEDDPATWQTSSEPNDGAPES